LCVFRRWEGGKHEKELISSMGVLACFYLSNWNIFSRVWAKDEPKGKAGDGITSDNGDSKDDNKESGDESTDENKDEGSTDEKDYGGTVEVPKGDGIITEEKFEIIKLGMTYEEVINIIGSIGTILLEDGKKGEPGYTVDYTFVNEDTGAATSFKFEDNILSSKTQLGLYTGPRVEITLDQFNQLKIGMTFEEVTKLLGGEGDSFMKR